MKYLYTTYYDDNNSNYTYKDYSDYCKENNIEPSNENSQEFFDWVDFQQRIEWDDFMENIGYSDFNGFLEYDDFENAEEQLKFAVKIWGCEDEYGYVNGVYQYLNIE